VLNSFPVTYLILAAILAVALWLRVFGPTWSAFDWGQGNFQHPDENFVGGTLVANLDYPNGLADLFNPNSKWNPAVAAGGAAGFNYGSLPLYLIKIFGSILGWLGAHIPALSMWQTANPILVGRVLSGIFDTITVFLVFLLGKRLAGERTGLFAAALACFAVLSMQLAHFTTVDSFLGTFATGTILASVTLFEEGRTRDYAILGIWLAAALATKASAVALLATVALALLWRQLQTRRLLTWETVQRCVLLGVVTLVAFFIFQPYTFVDWANFKAGVNGQNDLATGREVVFYTIKWANTTPILYPFSQLTNYSLGIPLALLAYAGLIWQGMLLVAGKWHRAAVAIVPVLLVLILCCIVAAAKYPLTAVQYQFGSINVDTIVLTAMEAVLPVLCLVVALFLPKRSGSALVAFFVATYFISAGLLYMKYLRYMEPIVPSLCVLAALLVAALVGARAKAARPAPAPGIAGAFGSAGVSPDLRNGEALAGESYEGEQDARAPRSDWGSQGVGSSGSDEGTRDASAPSALRPGRWRRGFGYALGAAVLLLTACYGLAYQHIYAQPLTRNQAACWMYQNIPAGATIMQDNPDEGQPNGGFDGCNNGRAFTTLSPTVGDYDDDSMTKVMGLAPFLAQTQYYIINSERAISSFQNYGSKYPYMQRFYQLLLGSPQGVQDALGFTLVYHAVEHPQLGPWTDTEQGSDQNFNEYDHPPVWIFENTGKLSGAQIIAVMTDHWKIADPTVPPSPGTVMYDNLPKSLMLSAKDIATNQNSPTYAVMFPADGLPMRFPIPVWWLMIEFLGLLALPISMRLFSRLGDCGFAISKTVGILLLAWFAWILPSMGWAEYSRQEIALCLLPVAAISLAWGVRLRDIPRILRRRLSAVALAEGAFILGYLFFVWLRAIYPDFGHSFDIGEKTMDFSYLNAIVRSRVLPPLDPWFSGGYLNYYYYGHFTVATLLKLVGIAPTIAINLAMPTFFGLALASCVSIAYSLVKRIPFALLAGALGMLAGNMYGGQIMVGDLQAASPIQNQLHPVTSANSALPLLGGVINLVTFLLSLIGGVIRGTAAAVLGLGQVILQHQTLPWYSWRSWPWDGTRIYQGVITEFPFWTFLYADPHAHLWDIPFALCIVAVAYNFAHGATGALARTFPTARRDIAEVDQSKPLLPGLGVAVWPVIGILLGAIGPTNTWDLAGAFGILGLAIAGRSFWSGAGWLRTLWATGWRLVVLGILALGGLKPFIPFGLYRPFYDHFYSFYDHYGWTILRVQTTIHDFATYWALPLYVLSAYLLYAVWHDTNVALWLRTRSRAALFTLYYWDRRQALPRYFALVRRPAQPRLAWQPYWRRPLDTAVIALCALALAALLAKAGLLPLSGLVLLAAALLIVSGPLLAICVLGLGTVVLFLLINYLALAWLTALAGLAVLLLIDRRQRQEPEHMFLHLMLIMGLVVAAAAEIVYVVDFYDGDPVLFRSNTVFKLYEDAWLLLNISAAVALARLLVPFLPKRAPASEAQPAQSDRRLGVQPAMAGAASVAVASVEVAPHGDQPIALASTEGDALAGNPGADERPAQQGDPKADERRSQLGDPELQSGEPHGSPSVDFSPPYPAPATSTTGEPGEAQPLGSPSTPTMPVPEAADAPPASARRSRMASGRPGFMGWIWLGGLALLLVSAALYSIRMTPERLDQRATAWPALASAHIGLTLDSLAFMQYVYPDDYAAIQWINNNIAGSPVMLTSRYGQYGNFSGRVGMFTGLPTVVDWGFEVAQQRYNLQTTDSGQIYPEEVGLRERNVVDVIYSTTDPLQALDLLHQYNVSYVYVGVQERGDPSQLSDPNAFHGYPAAGLAKFPTMVQLHELQLVYQHGSGQAGVQIYKVLP